MKKKLNPNLIKIANMLSDGEYHDGNTIGEKIKMTRTSVWKMIKKLEQYGIHIEKVKGKGYALKEPLILLEAQKIKKKLMHPKLDMVIFESISSTNEYLKAFKNKPTIKICLAESQTSGKARLNRSWHSPFGCNIYLSCLYPFQKDISELAGLSLVTSLAIIKTLKSLGIKEGLSVKWPNDVIFEQKKISGGLIEIQAESHGISFAIIGIGLNVNMINDDNQIISQHWASVSKILGKYLDRNEVAAYLINHLINYLHQFNAYGFSLFKDEWLASDCLMHQDIAVKSLEKITKGKMIGVNDQGHLLLQLADGDCRTFSSGDTSIVKG